MDRADIEDFLLLGESDVGKGQGGEADDDEDDSEGFHGYIRKRLCESRFGRGFECHRISRFPLLLPGPSVAVSMSVIDAGGMTGIVWRRVNPTREAEAEGLMRGLMALARRSPGFLGSEIFPPIAGVQDAYMVLYRFSSGENLRRWLGCPERQEIFRQLEPMLLQPAFSNVSLRTGDRRRDCFHGICPSGQTGCEGKISRLWLFADH